MPEYFGVSNHRVSSLLSNGWKNRVYESVFKETMIEQMVKFSIWGFWMEGIRQAFVLFLQLFRVYFKVKNLTIKQKL